MKKNIFSGPMRGVSREISLGWRKEATKLLKNNFDLFHFCGCERKTNFCRSGAPPFIRDLNDIKNADIFLVNDTTENISMIGTSIEYFLLPK